MLIPPDRAKGKLTVSKQQSRTSRFTLCSKQRQRATVQRCAAMAFGKKAAADSSLSWLRLRFSLVNTIFCAASSSPASSTKTHMNCPSNHLYAVAFRFFAFGMRKGSKMKGYHFHYCFLLSVKHRRIVFRKKQGLNTIYTCKRYHRLTRADNAFRRAIPVCLIQLRPPRSAPPQSPMGNPGYGSAQVNPS